MTQNCYMAVWPTILHLFKVKQKITSSSMPVSKRVKTQASKTKATSRHVRRRCSSKAIPKHGLAGEFSEVLKTEESMKLYLNVSSLFLESNKIKCLIVLFFLKIVFGCKCIIQANLTMQSPHIP